MCVLWDGTATQQEVSLFPWSANGTSRNTRHGDLPGWSSEAGEGGRSQEQRSRGTKSCPREFSTWWQSGKQNSSLLSAACCPSDHSASLVAPGWSMWVAWRQTSSLELPPITFNLGRLLYCMLKPQKELKAEITTLYRGTRGPMYSWNYDRLSGVLPASIEVTTSTWRLSQTVTWNSAAARAGGNLKSEFCLGNSTEGSKIWNYMAYESVCVSVSLQMRAHMHKCIITYTLHRHARTKVCICINT